jgi:hypothetical protein
MDTTMRMTAASTALPLDVIPVPVQTPYSAPVPPSEPEWPMPKLLFVVEDMATPGGIKVFQGLTNPAQFLQKCIIDIYNLLYTRKSVPTK